MIFSGIIRELKSMRSEENVKGMARFGITGKKVLGIQVYKLRSLAKRIGRNHELALKLWETGIHEARILAVFIEEPDKVSGRQMDEWSHDFESWDDTDQACTGLFDKTKHSWKKVKEWSNRRDEFGKRAAFSLIAGLASHDKEASDEEFIKLFPIIKKASADNRNFVKKAVNWALRGIGKRNKNLNKEAVKLCDELIKMNNKTAKWIGTNALKELKNEKKLKD